MQETLLATKQPPIMASSSTLRLNMAIADIAPPSAMEPVSPMNTRAG